MSSKTKILEILKNYFQDKGRVLSAQEYARETDTPVRLQQIRSIFGHWRYMEKYLMASEDKTVAPDVTNIEEVLAARNEAAYEAAKKWKEASENQDVKARREAEAQVVAETLARNAATPEGANANKIAIGGKLPGEQQNYAAMGATTTVDPKTLEQVVVDTKPDVPTSKNEDPRTPLELRDAVAQEDGGVKGGQPDVDKSTAGGSTGEASIATVQALGAEETDAKDIKDTSSTNKPSTDSSRVPADETKKS